MINRERLVKTFCDLVTIDSPSGEETAVADELIQRLTGLGVSVARDDYGNLIGGAGEGSHIMLSAHMDTVEPGRGVSPSVEGDRIVSDGTTILGGDCKAGVSAILEAIESVREDDAAHVPYEIVFTREEETGLFGARKLDMSMIRSTEAVVFDGEGPVSQITSSSPTYISFDVEITGRAAHAGMEPEKGLSAIGVAADLVLKLPQGRLDHETTFNIGKIEGGQVRNAVPEKATLSGEFRSMNLETLDGVRMQITEALGAVRKMHPEATIDDSIRTEFETYDLPEDDPAMLRVKAALIGLGLTPDMKISGGGTDANVFRRKGISAVVVGMAVTGMHTKQEYVTIPDLVDAAHLCEGVLRA